MKERMTTGSLLLALFILICYAFLIVGTGRTEEILDVKEETASEYSLVPLCFNSLKVIDSHGEKEQQIPFELLRNKIPFLDASVSIIGDKEIDVSIYIDLASSEALELLVKPEMKFALPGNLKSKYLGKGLDGHILGQFGRVASLKIGSFMLRDVPTAFPKSEVRSRQHGADGILCNNALRRFNLIFDYSRRKLYIKPNSHFSESFD